MLPLSLYISLELFLSMLEYIVEVYRREDLPSSNDYWALSRKYNGVGFSDSQFDNELFGKYFNVFISSEKPLKLDDLNQEFPFIDIMGLTPKSPPS